MESVEFIHTPPVESLPSPPACRHAEGLLRRPVSVLLFQVDRKEDFTRAQIGRSLDGHAVGHPLVARHTCYLHRFRKLQLLPLLYLDDRLHVQRLLEAVVDNQQRDAALLARVDSAVLGRAVLLKQNIFNLQRRKQDVGHGVPLRHPFLDLHLARIGSYLRSCHAADRRPDKRADVATDITVYRVAHRPAEQPADEGADLCPDTRPLLAACLLPRSTAGEEEHRRHDG